ncbi:MAG TPA: hypothetical protein PLD50_24055, partial [Polyangiaceae bacterium]|nr:hypothetical protein [Polyangiaceae bacterium]
AQIALVLPVIVVVVVVVYALFSERKAIRVQLSSEQADGIVTAADLALLQNVVARETTYWKTLLSGKIRFWRLMRALHNRQVQLAFVKQNASRETNEERKKRLEVEISNLRLNIREQQTALGKGTTGDEGRES